MRSTRGATTLAMLSALVLSVTACGGDDGGGDGGDASTVEWEYLLWSPLSQPYGVFMQDYAADVEEATDGQLRIVVRGAGELPLTGADALTAIRNGDVEMADAYSGFVAGSSPLLAVPQYPFLITSVEELGEVIPEYEPFLVDDLAANFGAELLWWYPLPMQNFFGTGEPVTDLDGLRGKQGRSTSPQQVTFLEEVGAEPVSIASEELASALGTGVVEAFTASAFFTVGAGQGDSIDWAWSPGSTRGRASSWSTRRLWPNCPRTSGTPCKR